MRAYDEDTVLADYIWRHYGQYFTRAEHRASTAVWAERKETAGAADMKERVWRSQRLSEDATVTGLLADGTEAFHRRAALRVLAEHHDEILVNRCPKCERIVCTPKAQQCLWCGYDWHKREPGSAAT
jgi:hypothetical protein